VQDLRAGLCRSHEENRYHQQDRDPIASCIRRST
jgi:hypothetical protein